MDISPKKQEILKAARECFARFGYEKTTLDDIGKMVGLNKASLYYYYKNKEAIFAEVVFFEAEQYMQALYAKIQDTRGCREKILTYLKEKFRYMQKVMNLHNLSVESLRSIQPFFEKIYADFYEKEVNFIADILATCMKNDEIKPCDSKRIAKSILAVTDAIKLKALQGKDVRFADKTVYQKVEDEVVFIVSLILDGMITSHKNSGGK